MKTSDFHYELPEHLIAQEPLPRRDESRLLVASPTEPAFAGFQVRNLKVAFRHLFPEASSGPVLVLTNDTEVYPARVPVFRKSGGKGEVFVLSGVGDETSRAPIEVLLRPQKKLRLGEVLYCEASAAERTADGEWAGVATFRVEELGTETCRVSCLRPLREILEQNGVMPLPPYIRRNERTGRNEGTGAKSPKLQELDRLRYQTVYAQNLGSAAAPTAGLHFTSELIQELTQSGVAEFVPLTLHVGLGTFRPVQVEDPSAHTMHEEHYMVPRESMGAVFQALDEGRPIVFLGTTSFRAMESFLLDVSETYGEEAFRERSAVEKLFLEHSGHWKSTDLFVRPHNVNDRHTPQLGEAMFTNFHQPESTLLMLVSALCGVEHMRSVYAHALSQSYRFLSYGDASLLGLAQRSRLRKLWQERNWERP